MKKLIAIPFVILSLNFTVQAQDCGCGDEPTPPKKSSGGNAVRDWNPCEVEATGYIAELAAWECCRKKCAENERKESSSQEDNTDNQNNSNDNINKEESNQKRDEIDEASKRNIKKAIKEQQDPKVVREFRNDWNQLTSTVSHYMQQREENARKAKEYARQSELANEKRKQLVKKEFNEDLIKYENTYKNAIFQFNTQLERKADVMRVSEAIEKAYNQNVNEIIYTNIKISGPTVEKIAENPPIFESYHGTYIVEYYSKPGTIQISETVYENRFNIESYLTRENCFNCAGEPEFKENVVLASFTNNELYSFVSTTIPEVNKFQELKVIGDSYSYSLLRDIDDSEIKQINSKLETATKQLNTLVDYKNEVMNGQGMFSGKFGQFDSDEVVVYYNNGRYIKVFLKETPSDVFESPTSYFKEATLNINTALNSIYEEYDTDIKIKGVKGILNSEDRYEGYANAKYESNIVGLYTNADNFAISVEGKDQNSFFSFFSPNKEVYFSDLEELLVIHKDYFQVKFETGHFTFRDNMLFEENTGQALIGPGFYIKSEVDKIRRKKKWKSWYIVYDIINRKNGWYVHPMNNIYDNGEKSNYYVGGKIVISKDNLNNLEFNKHDLGIQIPLGSEHQNEILNISEKTNDFNKFYNLIKNNELKSLGGEILKFHMK